MAQEPVKTGMSGRPDAKKALRVVLTNRHASFQCDPDEQVLLKEVFRYRKPGSEFAPSFRSGEWDGWTCLHRAGRVAAGLFLDMRPEVEARWRVSLDDRRVAPVFRAEGKRTEGMEERASQDECLARMEEASTCGGVVLMAPGTGKTHTAGRYFRRLAGTGLFVVDELTLLEQSRAELQATLGEKVGVVGKSIFMPRRVTVATVQTLHRHRTDAAFRRWFDAVHVVMVDEVHVQVNKRNADVLRSIKPLAVFGLTGTLNGLGSPHVRFPVAELCGPVVYRYSQRDAVRDGVLVEGVQLCVEFHDPLKGRPPGYWTESSAERRWVGSATRAADYRYHVALNRARNDCVEALAREGLKRGRRVIVLVEQIAHLDALSRRMADVEHRSLSGVHAKPSERIAALRSMDAGDVPLLIASRVFGKGVNVRTLDTVIDATGLPNEDAAEQRLGRGSRKAEGKDGMLYVNVCDRGSRYEDAGRSRASVVEAAGARTVHVRWRSGGAAAAYDAAFGAP